MRTLALAVVLAAPALAQEPLGPRAFLPPEYQIEAFVDFAAMRDLEILDGMQRSLLKPVLGVFEDYWGFALDDLDGLRMAMVTRDPGEDRSSSDLAVVTFEGSPSVKLPSFEDDHGIQKERMGDREVLVQRYDWEGAPPGDVYFSPRDGLLVFGSELLVRPVLEGRRKGGVPTPELLALTTGRGNLAWFGGVITDRDLEKMKRNLPPVVPEEWHVPEDPPTGVLARLRRTGDDDDPRVEAQLLIRYRTGVSGPQHTEKLLRQGLDWLKHHRQLGGLKRYWNAIELKIDGCDLNARLDLGRARDAAGTIPMLIAPLFLWSVSDAELKPVEVVEVRAEPEKPKKDGKKKQ